MSSPRDPVWVAGALFVIDNGSPLRKIDGGEVRTIWSAKHSDNGSSRIDVIRGSSGKIYLLIDKRRIIAFDIKSEAFRDIFQAPDGVTIATFDIAPDGRLFWVTDGGQIWRSENARTA